MLPSKTTFLAGFAAIVLSALASYADARQGYSFGFSTGPAWYAPPPPVYYAPPPPPPVYYPAYYVAPRPVYRPAPLFPGGFSFSFHGY